MSSTSDLPRWLAAGLTVLLLLLALPAAAADAADLSQPQDREAWLVTYGPGEIYWQRFGHNAIWMRDSRLGLDHAFNFGFFDFAQENFFLRFLQGRMLYFSAAQPVRDEFAQYQSENRSIRLQKLDLSPGQWSQLAQYLTREVRPENRDYLYDYYRHNCSTRVRDAIDLALGGALSGASQPVVAAQSWRDHTRRLTVDDFWLYLGLEIGLGSPVDRNISQWDEMFIPSKLAEIAAQLELNDEQGRRALVTEDVMYSESTLPEPPMKPVSAWTSYLLVSLAVVAVGWLLSRWLSPRSLARTWFLLSGLAGLALLFLWFGTDHAVARLNLNLLVFNPLWLVFVPGRRMDAAALPLTGLFALLALVMNWLPPWQYNLDVLAAFAPLNLAAALALRRSGV